VLREAIRRRSGPAEGRVFCVRGWRGTRFGIAVECRLHSGRQLDWFVNIRWDTEAWVIEYSVDLWEPDGPDSEMGDRMVIRAFPVRRSTHLAQLLAELDAVVNDLMHSVGDVDFSV
jgi:hypothetical protein